MRFKESGLRAAPPCWCAICFSSAVFAAPSPPGPGRSSPSSRLMISASALGQRCRRRWINVVNRGKQRNHCRFASTSRMVARKLVAQPSPWLRPFVPARRCQTNLTRVWNDLLGAGHIESNFSRGSGTATLPTVRPDRCRRGNWRFALGLGIGQPGIEKRVDCPLGQVRRFRL